MINKAITRICVKVMGDEYEKSAENDESAYRYYTAESILEVI